MTPSSTDLQRFVAAQAPVMDEVWRELDAGAKRSHWMWFVFPQLRGLGRSAMASHFGIASRQEALDYLAHPVLGPRLEEAVARLLAVRGRSAHAIFGSPDDLKLCSCLTLFGACLPAGNVFEQALARYFDGRRDPATLQKLG